MNWSANLISCVVLVGVSCLAPSVGWSGRLDLAAVNLAAQPLSFEQNLGQYGATAAFVSRGPAYAISLSPTEVTVLLERELPAGDVSSEPNAAEWSGRGQHIQQRWLRIQIVGANPAATMHGLGPVAGRANYFLGADPAQWRTDVPTYQRVRVADVYPGINLVHYGNQEHLEYDFEVAPRADYRRIALRFFGADQLTVEAGSGDLVIRLGTEEIRQPRPVIYQEVAGRRVKISGGYELAGARTVQFKVGTYDRNLPLVIDPVISYAAYFSQRTTDKIYALAVGENADVYVAGQTTTTTGLVTTNAYQTNFGGVLANIGDAFVARLKNASSERVYVTYLGGAAYEAALGLAVDAEGCAIVTGYTASTNFPITNAVQPGIAGGKIPGFTVPALDAFITKIAPYGSNLVFSTFYGGSGSGYLGNGDDIGFGVALDASNHVYVTGTTYATNFPTRNTVRTNWSGAEDAFLLKLDATGTNVHYAMYLGGAGRDYGRDVVVNAAGQPIITGFTTSSNFPISVDAIQTRLNGSTNVTVAADAFVSVMEADSGEVLYSTYLGGTNSDQAYRLAADESGAVYVVGATFSGNFPRSHTNFYSSVLTNVVNSDAFVVKLTPGQTNVDYATTFGGAAREEARAVAVNAAGEALVVGLTTSTNYPTNAIFGILRGRNSGGADGFIAKLAASGDAFEYSAYLGDKDEDVLTAVAVDAGGNFYLAGEADTFPVLVKVLSPAALQIEPLASDYAVSWPAYAPDFNLQTSTNLQSGSWSTVTPDRTVTNGQIRVTFPATNPAVYFRLQR